ncbi:MAG: type II toxin-antitoxin system VapC family toxin [Beijerinckiaceae bacterium]
MIAIDSSAIVAILKDEPDGALFAGVLSSEDWLIGAPTVLEIYSVARRQGSPIDLEILDDIFSYPAGQIVPFALEHLQFSKGAFDRYGKGRGHPAQLNFGDCMAYAIAKAHRVPLLFKGNEFSLTDIEPAYLP